MQITIERQNPTITGAGASAGIARGRATVVRGPADIHKVQPGDVLVCEMMVPTWTPLLATVSAIVADKGGILSNGAVIAREFQVPCVVQTAVGTAVIRDGMFLTVDGSSGIVAVATDPRLGDALLNS